MQCRRITASCVVLCFWARALFGVGAPVSGQADIAWDMDWYKYRTLVHVGAGGYARDDKPVEVEIDFSKLIRPLGRSDFIDSADLAVLECTGGGATPVAFQFDKAEGFHPWTSARGTLTFIMEGRTRPDAQRDFLVYFGIEGFTSRLDVPDSGERVWVEEVAEHEGQESFRVRSSNATYYYHKLGAGFASLEDADGQDWLSYNPGVGPKSDSGSGGKYRGTPNMGHPEGYCHPGNAASGSTVVSRGPVKVTVASQSKDGKMACRWDIFASYARMMVLRMRTPYWFLYEGTPGGKLDMDSDLCVRPSGEGFLRTSVAEKWDGDLPSVGGGEWLYFADPKQGRSLYLVHHEDDEQVDSYWPMNEEMTVFGFGRLGIKKFMQIVPAHFTIGLTDDVEPEAVQAAVDNAFRPLAIAVGSAEMKR